MAEETYEIVDAKDITAKEFYAEYLKATVRELSGKLEKGLSPEDWPDFVRYETNSCLDKYLPIVKSGNIGIKYTNPVAMQYEGNTEYNTEKAIGVTITLVFDFEKEIDVPKD